MPDTPSTTTATDAELIGGRYRTLDEIGRGGMATVVRARDEVLDRQVAIKILHGHLASDPAFADRFRREARAAAALSHPNVVSLYDWGEDETDGPFMVLELVRGLSLRDVLRLRGRLAPAEALSIVGPAAQGLHAAHRAGLVHRDVKPENVLLSDDGEVKVTDFGLARAAASSTQTFGADVIVGSPHYLAPEAVNGQPLDARADVYSLGVMLYEVLTGRPPFEGETPLATALQHTNATVPRPSALVPGTPASVDRVGLTATAADPDDRYTDAGEFAEALAYAVPEGPVAVDLRDGSRDTVVIPAASTDTLVALGSAAADHDTRVTFRSGEGSSPDAEDDTERPRRRRGRRFLILLVVLALLGGGGYVAWDRVVAPVTAVPNVVGEPQDAAVSALTDAGFEVVVSSNGAFDLEVPAEHVLRQSSEEARRGSTVTLTLSLGPAPTEIRELRGLEEAAALERLESVNLVPQVERAFSDDVPAGIVIGTTPEAGTVVDEGSSVTVTVSKGPQPREIPALAGVAEQDALAQLRDMGLAPRVVDRVYSDDVAEGNVVGVSPAPGEQVPPGTEVELTISRGSEPFAMPDVRGQAEDEATATLRGLGLAVEVEYVDTVFFFRAGKVDETDPTPGNLVRRGERVTLYVWR